MLVLLEGPVKTLEEIHPITTALYPLQMQVCNRASAAIPAELVQCESGEFQLHRTAKKEGIAL